MKHILAVEPIINALKPVCLYMSLIPLTGPLDVRHPAGIDLAGRIYLERSSATNTNWASAALGPFCSPQLALNM